MRASLGNVAQRIECGHMTGVGALTVGANRARLLWLRLVEDGMDVGRVLVRASGVVASEVEGDAEGAAQGSLARMPESVVADLMEPFGQDML